MRDMGKGLGLSLRVRAGEYVRVAFIPKDSPNFFPETP
jgi:hypothetical protein